jgi:hypothetical protein
MPGFIKDINGSKRMRFVKQGHDPNNLNLNPNDVIFDSETDVNLSIVDSDTFEDVATTGNPGPRTLASWSPPLPYTPMALAYYATNSGQGWSGYRQAIDILAGTTDYWRIISRPSGITLERRGVLTLNTAYRITWAAFRLPI